MTSQAWRRIEQQMLWDRLLAVVEEQAQTLIRTAFSTTVREAGDLSCGVFDTRGRMLAQAVTGTPGHVNAMAASVPVFLQHVPLASLQPGDVLVTNDPWHGTGHLNDFTVVTPAFRDGEAIALFASTSHIADVGGLGFGAEGRQVYEEGLNIPIGHLFRAGEPDRSLFAILRANVRDPAAAEGDLYSLAACNQAGVDSLLASMAEFGLENLDATAQMIIDSSRAAMLEDIRRLPTGCWQSHMRIDGYETPVDLHCSLRIHHEGIDIDFAGSSPTCPHGINVPLSYCQAYAAFGVRCIIGNEIPNNAGSLERIRISAPPGSILNAPRPAAVSARHVVGQMLPDVVLGALAQPLGGAVPAEGASCLFGPVFMGGAGVVRDSSDPPFVINAFFTGGTGARPEADGLSCTAFPSGVRSTPVEIIEASAPLLIWRKELRPDSGGAGQFRGGLGQIIEFAHARGEAFIVSKMFDRMHHPARGREGGEPGAPTRLYLQDGRSLTGMGREQVPTDCRLVLETAGGGGRGAAAERSPERLEQDLRQGLRTHTAD